MLAARGKWCCGIRCASWSAGAALVMCPAMHASTQGPMQPRCMERLQTIYSKHTQRCANSRTCDFSSSRLPTSVSCTCSTPLSSITLTQLELRPIPPRRKLPCTAAYTAHCLLPEVHSHDSCFARRAAAPVEAALCHARQQQLAMARESTARRSNTILMMSRGM